MADETKARMTGPEHFRKAEELIAIGGDPNNLDLLAEHRMVFMTAAQAHATLALVAVTADLATHTAPPAMRSVGGGDGQWKALLNPTEKEADHG